MGILDKLETRPRIARAGYAAAAQSRLTSSLATEAEYINYTLRTQRRALVARARQGAQNNPYLKRFFQLCVDNIAGPSPFRLQAKIKYNSGKFDDAANRQIEEAWAISGRKGHWDLTQRWSRTALTRLMVRTLAIDGEMLVRKLRGRQYGPNGYQLQLIDSMRLDDMKNESLQDGGAIHMGIELDANGKPVAYHILKRRPNTWQGNYYSRESDRIPASEIEHIFIADFAEQNRGVPWVYAALLNLIHIGAFEEAAVIAARVGATQMGFLQQREDANAPLAADGKDSKGNPQIDAEPASFQTLPPGYEMSAWMPKFPDAAVDPFLKAMLRGTASGLGVAYHNLANDPGEVNFSTARVFGGDEHEMWRGLQVFWSEHWEEPNYAEWLRVQVLNGNLPFDSAKLEKYLAVTFIAKTWQSPDPVKEQEANDLALRNKLKSRTRIIAEGGDDIEDVFDEIAAEEALAKLKKVDLTVLPKPQANPKPAEDAAGQDAGKTKGREA